MDQPLDSANTPELIDIDEVEINHGFGTVTVKYPRYSDPEPAYGDLWCSTCGCRIAEGEVVIASGRAYHERCNW